MTKTRPVLLQCGPGLNLLHPVFVKMVAYENLFWIQSSRFVLAQQRHALKIEFMEHF